MEMPKLKVLTLCSFGDRNFNEKTKIFFGSMFMFKQMLFVFMADETKWTNWP